MPTTRHPQRASSTTSSVGSTVLVPLGSNTSPSAITRRTKPPRKPLQAAPPPPSLFPPHSQNLSYTYSRSHARMPPTAHLLHNVVNRQHDVDALGLKHLAIGQHRTVGHKLPGPCGASLEDEHSRPALEIGLPHALVPRACSVPHHAVAAALAIDKVAVVTAEKRGGGGGGWVFWGE
eukprot:361186-Chlamydomonas_euryale.AAC.7